MYYENSTRIEPKRLVYKQKYDIMNVILFSYNLLDSDFFELLYFS